MRFTQYRNHEFATHTETAGAGNVVFIKSDMGLTYAARAVRQRAAHGQCFIRDIPATIQKFPGRR